MRWTGVILRSSFHVSVVVVVVLQNVTVELFEVRGETLIYLDFDSSTQLKSEFKSPKFRTFRDQYFS
jgi:hypothetical protein